jgi:hypothetical protein
MTGAKFSQGQQLRTSDSSLPVRTLKNSEGADRRRSRRRSQQDPNAHEIVSLEMVVCDCQFSR